jgi:hypothetical protein
MTDLVGVRGVLEAELNDFEWRGEERPNSQQIAIILLALEANMLLTPTQIGDPEEWRKRVQRARQFALDQVIKGVHSDPPTREDLFGEG